MSILVIAECYEQQLNTNYRNAISAALQLDKEVHLLVGVTDQSVLATIKQASVTNVFYAENFAENSQPIEKQATALFEFIKQSKHNYTHVIATASTFSKNLIPRLAALNDSQPIADVIKVLSPNTFVRPIYAGNALAEITTTEKQIFMTIRDTAFVPAQDSMQVNVAEEIPADVIFTDETIRCTVSVENKTSLSDRPQLSSAKKIVAGGRGLGSQDNFEKIKILADTLDAAVGASRAAVDAGFITNDFQVGQTGKIVAPDLYIAIGISGAIQHLAGMKESKVIVAINNDSDAPIFKIADYCWQTDLFVAIDELKQKISSFNQQ